jgi:hypothetical protein
MEQKPNKSAQFKQWIKSIVIGRFRYKYEYTSPFGNLGIFIDCGLGVYLLCMKM